MTRLTVLCAVLVAACGSASAKPSGDEAAIRHTIDRYAAAVRANDVKTICNELMGAEIRDVGKSTGVSCEELWGDQIAKGGPRYEITIDSISINGDRAIVKSHAVEQDGGPRADTQPLTRIGGRWLLTK